MMDTQINEAQRLHYEVPHLSIGQKAERVGVSKSTFYKWLSGGKVPQKHRARLQELISTHGILEPRKKPEKDLLTYREREVLRLIAQGYRNSEIACLLCILPATVNTHIKSLLEKTRLSSRTQLIIYALKTGIISLDEIELRHVERREASES